MPLLTLRQTLQLFLLSLAGGMPLFLVLLTLLSWLLVAAGEFAKKVHYPLGVLTRAGIVLQVVVCVKSMAQIYFGVCYYMASGGVATAACWFYPGSLLLSRYTTVSILKWLWLQRQMVLLLYLLLTLRRHYHTS